MATRAWPLQIALGIVLGTFTLCCFSALRHLPEAEGTAINVIAPFIVMPLAGPLLGEKVCTAACGRVRKSASPGCCRSPGRVMNSIRSD